MKSFVLSSRIAAYERFLEGKKKKNKINKSVHFFWAFIEVDKTQQVFPLKFSERETYKFE